MNYFSQFDQEIEEQYEFSQSVGLASLFPERSGVNAELTSLSLSQFYKQLICTLCNDLLSSPVYLKCSHRFCRPCIEKYIRSRLTKKCPSCTCPLLSKRELKTDDFAIDFIDILAEDFQFKSQKNKDQSKIKVQEPSEVVQLDAKKRRGRPKKRPESLEIQMGNENPRKRRRKNNQSSFELSDPSGMSQSFFRNLSDEVSQSKEQIRESRESNPQEINQNNASDPNASDPKYKSLENKEKEQEMPSFYYSLQQESRQKVKKVEREYGNNYGREYFKCLTEILNREVLISIRLAQHPSKPFTPHLNCEEIKCSINSPASVIYKFIAERLNISSQHIKLYVESRKEMNEIYLHQKLTEVNEKYWMVNQEITVSDLANMINSMTLADRNENAGGQRRGETNQCVRVIYFSVEFEKSKVPSKGRR